MAVTSKYIALNPQILVEYRYSDPVNPDYIETDLNGARLLVLGNSYTNSSYIFTEDNPYIPTGNYRYRSALSIDSLNSQYAFLTNDNVVNYLDFDPNIPSVNDLLSQETSLPNVPKKNIAYDTIRIHLVSGFSFEGIGDGFIFEVLVKDRAGIKHNLTSLVYRSTDNYEILNPVPFISDGKLFSKYIEVKIPALSWLTDEYVNDPQDADNLSNIITKNAGFNFQNTIELSLKYIDETIVQNGQTYFTIGEGSTGSINKTDEYSGLSAVIEESSSGDYFELYGEYNGDVYEDFIVALNNEPNTDLVVVHDINVLEQVGESFIITSEQSYIQTSNFEDTYKFRPIIINSSVAVSYRIDYTLRILNKVDNSQIIRNSQYSSFDVKKYGKRMTKINLGTSPLITKVYNEVPSETQNIVLNNDVSFTLDGNMVIKEKEFVSSFKETIKISASITNVKTEPAVKQEGDIVPTAPGSEVRNDDIPLSVKSSSSSGIIYTQGEGAMTISPFDTFVKFILYDNSIQEATGASSPQLMNLTNMGTFYISFVNNEGDEVRLSNFTNIKDINPANGEVVFKIDKDNAKKILKYDNNTFYISSRLEIGPSKSDETLAYTGKWYQPTEKLEEFNSKLINDLNKEIEELRNKLNAEESASNQIISELEKENKTLNEKNKILENRLIDLTGDINSALTDIKNFDSGIDKKESIKTNQLNGSKSTANLQSIKNKIRRGQGQFTPIKSYERLKGISVRNFKINP